MSTFGYHVSPARRQEEVTTAERLIAQIDNCNALSLDPGATPLEIYLLPVADREQGYRMGLTLTDIADLCAFYEAYTDWPEDLPIPAPGLNFRAQTLTASLASRFGPCCHPVAARPSLRKAAVRRRATALRALR